MPFLLRSARNILLLLVLLVAVGTSVDAQRSVLLQLRWDHQFQFAGYYAALWNGYYEAADLDVEIRSAVAEDGTVVSAVDEVAADRADFGIGATDIVYARAGGAPLVVTASVFQRSGAAFFSRPGVVVRTPADLVGLRVSRRIGDMVDIEFQAMLWAEGIDPSRVEPHPFDQSAGYLEGFQTGEIDVLPGYVIGTPHEAAELGIELGVLRPIDYGVDFYGDSLFTNKELAEGDPELVKDFTAASLRGWRYALEHPHEVAERIIQSYSPRFPIEDWPGFVRFQIEPVRDLTLHEIVEVGNVNPARWERMHETLVELGLAEGEFDVDAAIFDPVRLAEEQRARQVQIALYVLIALLSIIALGGVWIVTLRRVVAAKTRQIVEQETRSRELVERTSAIVYSHEEGVGTRIHSAAPTVLGYSREELAERPNLWSESVEPEDRSRVVETIQNAAPLEPIEVEYRVRDREGTTRWILDKTTKRPMADGRLASEGIAIDITRRKELEIQLHNLVERQDRLMHELNHRVKNNLALVMSLINLKNDSLGDGVDLSDIAHHVGAIRSLHEMLLSGAEVGAVGIRDYIAKLLASLFSLATKPVDVQSTIDDFTAPSDVAVSVGLVVNELGTNALKYGFDDDGGTFVLSCRVVRDRAAFELIVENSGAPIPEEVDLEDPKTLGLRLVAALVAQLRATVDIRRAPTPQFRFLIPFPAHGDKSAKN